MVLSVKSQGTEIEYPIFFSAQIVQLDVLSCSP